MPVDKIMQNQQAKKEPWYKGKEVLTHKWVYGNRGSRNELFQDTKRGTKRYLVDPKSVSRFSGLKDVNKRGLYEGDIVEMNGDFGELYGIIKFAETSTGATPKGFYVWDENGGMWKMNENLNIIKGPQGKCEKFEVYVHCYDHYGPDWNTLD